MRNVKKWKPVLWGLAALLFFSVAAYGDDHKIRRVTGFSIDGMHAIDMALFIKNNSNSTLARLSAQGINYTSASSTRPSDSIPATVGIFTGGSPASGGMYYDDAYNRSWFPPTNPTCSVSAGAIIDLKFAITASPHVVTIPDPNPPKSPRPLVHDG